MLIRSNTMRIKLKEKKCRYRPCQTVFEPRTKWQEFCKPECRTAAYNKKTAELIRKGLAAELAEKGAQ